MTQPDKRRYAIDLTASRGPHRSPHGDIRPITDGDRDSLAQLMLDAYTGTIDYEGESIVEARQAVDDWFSDAPLLGHSFGAEMDGHLVSAVLAMTLDDAPFIAIVMTAPDYKGNGLGRAVVAASLESLRKEHHGTVTLYTTEGNIPSERLFASLGAVEIADLR